MGRTSVLFIAAFIATACNGKDDTSASDTAHTGTHTGTDTAPAEWITVAEGVDGAFLSVSAPDVTDMYVVGSDTGAGPLFYNYDGSAWTKLDTGSTGDLWWTWNSGGDMVLAVGEAGRVVTYSKSAGTFSEEVLDGSQTFFGAWGSSESDIWVVGGDSFSSDNAQLWHNDGTGWSQWTDVPVEFEDNLYQAFKVWGTGPNDVWVIGTGMFTMHYDGSTWTYHDTPIDSPTAGLFTVTGDGNGGVYTVGGAGSGVILSWDGSQWVDESPEFASQLTGVYANSAGEAIACGQQSHVYHRGSDGTWTEDERGSASILDMHACWLDPDGGLWAMGGYLTGNPMNDGFIVYGGDSPPNPL